MPKTQFTETMELSGSNVEQTVGGLLPAKANLMGVSDGTNIRAFSGNMDGTLLASAARTATTLSAVQTNNNARGIILFLNITVASGAGGLRLTIHGRDPISNNDVQLNATPTAILATGIYTYELYPGATAAAIAGSFSVNQFTPAVLTRSWRAIVNVVDASSYTYSLGYSLIV